MKRTNRTGLEAGVISEYVGQLSINPYFHFRNVGRTGKFIPFVTAGYTGTHNLEEAENWFNVDCGDIPGIPTG